MAIRNCKEIGENLQKIVKRLMANDNLVKYLYYESKDPLDEPDLSTDEKNELIFEKLIKIIPKVTAREDSKSIVSIIVDDGTQNAENSEFRDIDIRIEVFVPYTQWIIKGTNLRPFAILGEIQESLNNKTINGLGKMTGGDFSVNFLTEEMSSYTQNFRITSYE